MSKLKHKISVSNNCAAGKHTFIPIAWRKTADKETCTLMACQSCFITIDRIEREVMSQQHEEAVRKKIEKDQAVAAKEVTA